MLVIFTEKVDFTTDNDYDNSYARKTHEKYKTFK